MTPRTLQRTIYTCVIPYFMLNHLYHQSSIFAEQMDKFIKNGCQQMINGKLIILITKWLWYGCIMMDFINKTKEFVIFFFKDLQFMNANGFLETSCDRVWFGHEVGIVSNHGSTCRVECVPGPCTHCPLHPGNLGLWQEKINNSKARFLVR